MVPLPGLGIGVADVPEACSAAKRWGRGHRRAGGLWCAVQVGREYAVRGSGMAGVHRPPEGRMEGLEGTGGQGPQGPGDRIQIVQSRGHTIQGAGHRVEVCAGSGNGAGRARGGKEWPDGGRGGG